MEYPCEYSEYPCEYSEYSCEYSEYPCEYSEYPLCTQNTHLNYLRRSASARSSTH